MKCISCGSNLLKSNSLLKCVRCGKEYTFEEIKVNLNGFKSNKSSEDTEKSNKVSSGAPSEQLSEIHQNPKEPSPEEKLKEIERTIGKLKSELSISKSDVPGTHSLIEECDELRKKIERINSDEKFLCESIPEAKELLEKVDNIKALEVNALSVDEIEIPGVKEVEEQLKTLLEESAYDEKTKQLSVLQNAIAVEKNKLNKNKYEENVKSVKKDIKAIKLELYKLSFFRLFKKKKLQGDLDDLEKNKLPVCIKLFEEFVNTQNKKISELTNKRDALKKDINDIRQQADLLIKKKEQLINDYRNQYALDKRKLLDELDNLTSTYINECKKRIEELKRETKSIVLKYKKDIKEKIKQLRFEQAKWELKRSIGFSEHSKLELARNSIGYFQQTLPCFYPHLSEMLIDATIISIIKISCAIACECDAPLNTLEEAFADKFIGILFGDSSFPAARRWEGIGKPRQEFDEYLVNRLQDISEYRVSSNATTNQKNAYKDFALSYKILLMCFLTADNTFTDAECEMLVHYMSILEGEK